MKRVPLCSCPPSVPPVSPPASATCCRGCTASTCCPSATRRGPAASRGRPGPAGGSPRSRAPCRDRRPQARSCIRCGGADVEVRGETEVVAALPIGHRGMHTARLRVHEIRREPVAITPEQRVRQRAVAPADARAVQVAQEQRHGVEQPLQIAAARGREAHEEAPVLHRVADVLGDENPSPPLRMLPWRGPRAARRPRGAAGPGIRGRRHPPAAPSARRSGRPR